MLEVELYKIVDAGHFWCKPSSKNKNEAENYYTLIGKINDYCCKTEKQSDNEKSKIPKKGKNCLVKRTSDKCWYRAKVLSVFQTMNGPQARVLLVDLGERTLVPGIWIQDIPEEFLKIPYQTMECVLSGLKPLTMVTSYFDLSVKKQPVDTWDVSATDWLKTQINGCNLQVDVKYIDDDGVHHVFLFAFSSDSMVCLNDELVNNEFAIFSKSSFESKQDQKNVIKGSHLDKDQSKDRAQDSFTEELKDIRKKLNNSLSFNGETSSSGETGKQSKYQPLTWSEDSESSTQGSGSELGKQPIGAKVWKNGEPISMQQSFSRNEDKNKVRFMSARLPATGSKSFQPFEGLNKQPKPILKNSSGYSSSEDSQRDFSNQRNVPEYVAELSKTANSSTAHDQMFYSTNDHNSNFSTQKFSQQSLETHVRSELKAPSSSFTHDQNSKLTSQRKDAFLNSNTGGSHYFQTHNQELQKNIGSQKNIETAFLNDQGVGLSYQGQRGPQNVKSSIATTFSGQDYSNLVYSQSYQQDKPGSTSTGQSAKNKFVYTTKQSMPNSGTTFQAGQTYHQNETVCSGYFTSSSNQSFKQNLNNNNNNDNMSSSPGSVLPEQNFKPFMDRSVPQQTRNQNVPPNVPSNPPPFPMNQPPKSTQIPGSHVQLSNMQSPGASFPLQHTTRKENVGSCNSANEQMSSNFPQQNTQKSLQNTQCQILTNTYFSSSDLPNTSNMNSSFRRQNVKSEIQNNAGQYHNSDQSLTTQNMNSNHPVSSNIQQHRPNVNLTSVEKNRNEFPKSIPSQNFATPGYTASAMNQQRQNIPGNSQIFPNYQSPKRNVNNQGSSSQISALPQQNIQPKLLSCQSLSPVTSSSSSYQNFPQNVPSNPPTSAGNQHLRSTKIPASQVLSPYIPSSSSYRPKSQNFPQSTDVINNTQPLQNIPPRSSRYTPITTLQSHQVSVSPVKSTNVPYCHQQKNSIPAISQSIKIPSNTLQFPSVPDYQTQSIHASQSTVEHRKPCGSSQYSHGQTSQSQFSNVVQHGKHQQNFHPYSLNCTFGYPNVPNYQMQSKTQEVNVPCSGKQNCSVNELGFPNESTNLQDLSPTYGPVNTTKIRQQNPQLPSKQSGYNSKSTSESPNAPASWIQSTKFSQSENKRQNYLSTQSQDVTTDNKTTGNLNTSAQTQTSESTNAAASMAQSLDILKSTTPSQRIPTGQTSSDIHNNQEKLNHYPSSVSSEQRSAGSFTSSNFHRSPVQTSPVQRSLTKSPKIPSSPMPIAKLCHVTGDVIIHGEFPPCSATEIFDLKTFPESVQRGLRDLHVTQPSSFQVNIWSAIMRGRDVFGIPETSGGNVMAYLAPVITQLTQSADYSKLPLGNGALALIVCEGWQKATTVYEQCRKLTKNIQNIRVQIIYGAGAEDECIPMLINGCEILIATVPCLLRMLKKKSTRLDRLCHLVFDDSDILAEEQTECIKILMREYVAILSSQTNREAPRQCIAIGNKWTVGICSLVKAYLGNPLIIIGNQIEAAMFCEVRQIVNYVSSSQRESELIRLLDEYTVNNDHEIIVFTSTAKDAERVVQLLEHYSFTAILAHEFLWPEQLIEVRRQWNTPHSSDSFLILVMTDGVIDKCNVKTATCVIHYDSAPTKKLFGKRMYCMASSYPSTKEKECISVTIGTEYTIACARSIKELILRSGGVLPQTLEEVCEVSCKDREEKKKHDDLCTYLKAFGQCNDLLQCKNRHTIFPDVDISVLLPKCGIVKVLILAVLDAARYFVRILEHRDDNEKINNYYSGATFLKLALDLNNMYTSRDNRHVCSRIQLQKICVVESDGSYYRAKLVQVVHRDPETNRPLDVQVYFIDRGFYEVVPYYNLFEIAPQFLNIPYQAVEAYVCRVKPLDGDKHWTNKSVKYVAKHIEGQELEGKIIMGLRNTIWLDPLVAKQHLNEINVTTNTFNVRLDLLREELAVSNHEHVENLKKHFTSFLQLKDVTGRENSDSDCEKIETCSLPEQGYEMVKVSSIHNPQLFFVRLDVNINSLEDLVDQINEDIEAQTSIKYQEYTIGSLCVAKFADDERWYRAKILSIRPEKEYDVFFVDYGDREWITQDRIAPIRPEYLQFPFQAIECSLVNISPVGSEWIEDDGEALWKLVDDKLLWAKVESKSAALLGGTYKYDIELCDTSTERNVYMTHELIIAGHAQATLEYHKTLFPEAFDSNTTGHRKEQYQEIPALCLQLHTAQDESTKLRYAQEIRNIVSENMKRKDDIRESGGVRCICQLLGLSKIEGVQEYIIITLAFLATQNDLNCEEIRREGGLKILCDLFTKSRNVKIQEHAAWTVKILASSERNRDATRELGGIKKLCDLLANTDNEKVQDNICWSFVSLCSDNNHNCDAIREAGGLTTLLQLLERCQSNSVVENAMWAISLLAYNASNKKLIGEQGGIEIICNLVKENQDEKILQNAVRCLKTLSSYNDENREIMCRLGMIDLMRRLSSNPDQLPFDTRRTCLDLIQRLLGRAPNVPLIEASSITSPLQEPIKYKPIAVTKKRKPENGAMVNGGDSDGDLPYLEDTMDIDKPSVRPMTMWSQTKRFVSLSIKLRGVKDKTSIITQRTFYFRTKHLEKIYELNLELFADIISEESKVHLRGSEVLVNLKKAKPETWQRLLATTEKPPFLSVDFDRWDSNSGSEQDSEIKQPKVPSSTVSTHQGTKVIPRPYDDDSTDASELSSDDEDTRERIGFDFC